MTERWTAEAAQAFLDDVFAPWIKAMGLKVDQVTEAGLAMRLPQNADLIRALLLAGIRAAFVWRQSGGARWKLIFQRHYTH